MQGEESVIIVGLTAYGVAGNGHSLDASLKLPRPEMSATLLPLEDTLGKMRPITSSLTSSHTGGSQCSA